MRKIPLVIGLMCGFVLWSVQTQAVTEELCKYFLNVTLNKELSRDEFKNLTLQILPKYYDVFNDEQQAINKATFRPKIEKDAVNCFRSNGINIDEESIDFAIVYKDNFCQFPLGDIEDILDHEQMDRYWAKKEEIRQKEMEAKQKAAAQQAQEKKIRRQQICQQLISDLKLSDEEFQYLIPSTGVNFGEYLCLGRLGQTLIKFSKPGIFDKSYTAVHEFPGGQEVTLKFKHDDNQFFQQEAKNTLEVNGTALNVEISIGNETLKPKGFREALLMFVQFLPPMAQMVSLRAPDDYKQLFD